MGGLLTTLFGERVEVGGRTVIITRQLGEGGFSVVVAVKDACTLSFGTKTKQ